MNAQALQANPEVMNEMAPVANFEGQDLDQAFLANAEGQVNPTEAVAENLASRFNGLRRKIAVGAAIGVSALGATEVAQAGTTTYKEGNTEFTQTSTSTALVGRSKMSAESAAKAKVVGNYRTVAKAKIKQLKKQGKCDTISGAKAMKMGLATQGYNGSGKGYHLENRKSTMCDVDGDGDYDVRAECGNRSKGVRPQPKKAKEIVWVNNFNKAKVNVRSKVSVTARSGCRVKLSNGEVYADASGSASAAASASVSARSAFKAKGKGLTAVKTRQVASLTASTKTKAKASANTYCVSVMNGEVVPPKTPPTPPKEEEKPKDSTQTPVNQGGPTGYNPAPAPENSESSECYNPTTGEAEACA